MAKSSDEIKELQRSINRLQRADGTVLHVGGRAYLVQAEAVVDPDVLLSLLARETVSEAEALDGLARGCRLESPARWIDGRWLGALQRDVKILEKHPDLAGITRQAPRLFRGQVIDRGWLAARRAQLDEVQGAYEAGAPGALPLWDAALVLARRFHGDGAAEELERIRERSTRVSAERRRETLERIEQVAVRLDGGEPPRDDPELAAFLDGAAQQLRRVEQLPGRARRKRLRQVVAALLAWPDSPQPVAAGEPTVDPMESIDPAAPLPQQMRSLAVHGLAQRSSTRSPEFQERLTVCLARYGLAFPPGPDAPDALLRFDEDLVAQALRRWSVVRKQLAGLPLRLGQVMELLALPVRSDESSWIEPGRLGRMGRWVASGLEISLLGEVARLELLRDLLNQESWDAETARAYCRWVTRLAPHYQRQGMQLTLTPKAFARLRTAKHEDLAVLGFCLLEHHAAAAGGPSARQITLLDATLALFQKLPDKARRCLEGLESAPAGLAASLCPDFAAWLEHDPALDRHLHLCGLLGVPRTPSTNLLSDFELAARRAAELAHLSALPEPNEAQRQRIAQLEKASQPPGPGWTKRRLAERNEALTLQLLERRIDQTLAEVLRRAYGLSLDRITPAWRDVFRFYLSTDRNQELLGLLLRNATAHPGRYFPPLLPRNREWLERAGERMRIEAWLRPRRSQVDLGGKRFTLEVEEDPVEVLRMGVPFNTCLSLEDGCNAAATVLNALDVNKRVLYLRDAAGKLVARQLIGVSSDFTFLCYRLYSAQDVPGLAQAFEGLCEEIAREAGLPLGDQGEPEVLHDGFWYDDGVEPLTRSPPATKSAPATKSPPTPVEEYCRFLGLPVPPEASSSLRDEAELWRALEAKDARRFGGLVSLYRCSLAQRELSARLVEELGIEKLARRYRRGDRDLLPVLVWHWKDEGAEALLRAVRRLSPSSLTSNVAYECLQGLTLSPAAMKEMALLATDLLARGEAVSDDGLEHSTMAELPQVIPRLSLAQLLDLCDRLAPVWDRVAADNPGCSSCRAGAQNTVAAAAEGVFLRDPDTRLVVSCLRSRRRSDLARRVALRILGRFPFPRQIGQSVPVAAIRAFERAPGDAPSVRKTLRELAVRHPVLGRSPEMLAAYLRQGASIDLSAWPVPDDPPFEVLADLVLHVPELVPWLAEHFGVPDSNILYWSPDPWELYVQRTVATPWRRRLAREVEERRSQMVLAAQWLHFLEAREQALPPAGHVDAERLRHALEVLWRERRELASAEAGTHPELARELAALAAHSLPPDVWVWWLAELRELTGGTPGPLLLDLIAQRLVLRPGALATALTPDLVLWLWSFPPLREPLLGVLAEICTNSAIPRLYRALREAARARSIDPQEILESWLVALLNRKDVFELTSTGDREILLLAIRTALARTGPKSWLRLYDELMDPLSATLFLNELALQPARQRQELRNLLQPVREDWQKPYWFWLEQALAPGVQTPGYHGTDDP